jgi:predicted nucleic acid-binding protein
VIVLDASILIKLFKTEDDSELARRLVRKLMTDQVAAGTPTLARYETLGAALHIGYGFHHVTGMFEQLQSAGFSLIEPESADLLRAETISTTPAPPGGYPGLFDSIYHAIALERGGVFVTADRRHIAKAGHFGSIHHLSEIA